MSFKGKMTRGEKWFNHRDKDGNLPLNIKSDPNKMNDVNFYLENKEKEPETKSKKVK